MSKYFFVDKKDINRFENTLKRIGKTKTKKIVVKAAQKGSNEMGKQIRRSVPQGKTKQLKKGFKKRKERSKPANKAVYEYAMDSAKNNIFQKPIKNPGILGGSHKYWGYYPNSVEYGFLAREKSGNSVFYKDGNYYTRHDSKGSVVRRYGRLYKANDKSYLDSAHQIDVVGHTRRGNVKAIETVVGFKSKKVEGQHSVRKAAEQAAPKVVNTIEQVLSSELDKEWKT